MSVRLFLVTFSLIVIMLITYWVNQPTATLVIRNAASNQLLWQHRVDFESAFSIRWTHSIHRTPVEEFFRIEGSQLILYRMSFQEYGIGMDTQLAPGEQLIVEDGHFVIEGMNRPFSSIQLYIGQVRAQHTLIFQGKEIPLSTLDQPGASVIIQVEQRSFIDKIGG